MFHIAHVAYLSEGKVMVIASLAIPVTLPFSTGRDFSWCNLLHSSPMRLLLLRSLVHVGWHAVGVLGTLSLLASVAFFSAFEIIILALRALPATLRELEVSSLLDGRGLLGVV